MTMFRPETSVFIVRNGCVCHVDIDLLFGCQTDFCHSMTHFITFELLLLFFLLRKQILRSTELKKKTDENFISWNGYYCECTQNNKWPKKKRGARAEHRTLTDQGCMPSSLKWRNRHETGSPFRASSILQLCSAWTLATYLALITRILAFSVLVYHQMYHDRCCVIEMLCRSSINMEIFK